ncbi:transcription antitermination factor NusB [Candidatus Dependentiae bacterium]|nr:transcription antitermination factor NusB [Candidatus Dependentiae bacterium]MCC7414522.1 transcription antitermination factor NusB [Campylobacterota bacterium]
MSKSATSPCAFEEQIFDVEQLTELSCSDLNQRQIRALVFHFLYAADAFEYSESLDALIRNFNHAYKLNIVHGDAVETMARAIIDERDELDERIKPLLHNWRFDRIGMSTKLVLRMALWELKQRTLDHKIVINEAIELSKCFAEDDAFKFVNGLLDEALKVDPSLCYEPKGKAADDTTA